MQAQGKLWRYHNNKQNNHEGTRNIELGWRNDTTKPRWRPTSTFGEVRCHEDHQPPQIHHLLFRWAHQGVLTSTLSKVGLDKVGASGGPEISACPETPPESPSWNLHIAHPSTRMSMSARVEDSGLTPRTFRPKQQDCNEQFWENSLQPLANLWQQRTYGFTTMSCRSSSSPFHLFRGLTWSCA
jgi:hypothetical protein